MEEQKIELKIINMADIRSQKIEWLWYPFIPYGKLTIIQGDPGDGKTTLVLNLAAKLSKGIGLDEDMQVSEPMNIIYQTAEDGLADTVKPRLEAAYRGMGSIDFFAVARSVLLVGRIEGQENTRAVVQIKNNLAAFGHSKAFELTEEGFHWLGDYEITADELLGGVTPKANKKERAKQLIYELAETNNVVKSEDIVNLAEEKGISKRTLENAKKELGIKGKRIGESWYWKLDEIVKP